MQIEFERGLVKSLVCGGIRGGDWGAETADRKSFFTLTERHRGCEYETTSCIPVEHGFLRRVETRMGEGRWAIDIETHVLDRIVAIKQSLTCLDSSVFQDFVVRFKFSKESFATGRIGGRTIRHANTNIWYQYPVSEATLLGPNGTATIRVRHCETAGKFRQELYIRDEPASWIVHVRFIPLEPSDLYWVRWGNRFFNWSLSDTTSRRILRARWIKNALWYLAERRGGRPALQAQGLAVLDPGTTISIEAECEIQTP